MDASIAALYSPGPELWKFGPFTLRWYGLLIATSVLLGLNLSTRFANKRNLENSLINDLLPVLILSSVIGARAYYVCFEWREYKNNLIDVFAIWKGGIAIHGALIAGALTVVIFCRLRKQPLWDVFDVLFPSVALGQAIGRWGNFFNNEAFGVPTNLPWKLYIPYIYRPEVFSKVEYFHPTFLYESIWNLCVFLLLLVLFNLGWKKLLRLPPGAITSIYLISYSLGRLWIEGLRTDPLCLGGVPPFCEGGLRAAQLLSIILFSIGLLNLWRVYKRKENLPEIERGGFRPSE